MSQSAVQQQPVMPWRRYELAAISDPLEQPHPLDPQTPRRLWRAWHYAVLIYPEADGERAGLDALLHALGGGPLYNAVLRQLRWMRRVSVDPQPILASIRAWQRDTDTQRRAIAAAKRNSKARRAL